MIPLCLQICVVVRPIGGRIPRKYSDVHWGPGAPPIGSQCLDMCAVLPLTGHTSPPSLVATAPTKAAENEGEVFNISPLGDRWRISVSPKLVNPFSIPTYTTGEKTKTIQVQRYRENRVQKARFEPKPSVTRDEK